MKRKLKRILDSQRLKTGDEDLPKTHSHTRILLSDKLGVMFTVPFRHKLVRVFGNIKLENKNGLKIEQRPLVSACLR